jgi:Alcohol dehydrogenase transcription factor Myb/SANT-like
MEDDNLITAVRRQPVLYDRRTLAYRNIEKREECWQIIADELGKTGRAHFAWLHSFHSNGKRLNQACKPFKMNNEIDMGLIGYSCKSITNSCMSRR